MAPAAVIEDPPLEHVSEWLNPRGKSAREAHKALLEKQRNATSQPKDNSREKAVAPSQEPKTVAEAPTGSPPGGLWRQAFERFHNNSTFSDVTFSFGNKKETLHGKGVCMCGRALSMYTVCLCTFLQHFYASISCYFAKLHMFATSCMLLYKFLAVLLQRV